jgi:ABC-type polysaccharide/polyol phosphate export permease
MVVSLSAAQRAATDVVAGSKMHRLWGALGWHDVRQRYRRSVIGPFWITLSMGAMIASLGVVYSGLFQQPIRGYLPYLAVGFIVWSVISAFLTEGCTVFLQASGAIKQMRVPLSVHVYRFVWKCFLIFLHNLIIYVPVAFMLDINMALSVAAAIPGIILLHITGFSLGLILGSLSARFRDVPLIMANFTQMMFFLTPILWRAQDLKENTFIADFNPLFHLIELVRRPLLSGTFPVTSWWVGLCSTVLISLVAVLLFARCRRRIAYWV